MKTDKPKPQRILMVVNILDRGGIETLLMNIYRNIDTDKIQFDFLEHPYSQEYVAEYESEIQAKGGIIYKAPRFIKNPITYCKFVYNLLKDHPEYKIIHGHNLDSCALAYMTIGKLCGRKVIAHSHNTRDAGSCIKRKALKLTKLLIARLPDYYFACSKQAGVFAYGGKICASNRFTVIHNGIDLSHYVNNIDLRLAAKKNLFPEQNGLVIGNVGRLHPQKNQKFLLDIFSEILKLRSSANLVLVGKGEMEKELKEYAKKLGINDHVIFAGSVSNVPEYLRAFDLFLFPSLYEGIALASIEAQATGLPLLISDTIDPDCICVPSAVSIMKLDDSADNWAKKAIYMIDTHRSYDDQINQVKKMGYDIHDVASFLVSFYKEV